MPGWQESIVGVSRYEDLPANARTYLEKLESLLEIPIALVSTGADRNETVIKRHPYD
jgi:adenylosuccinate synthase